MIGGVDLAKTATDVAQAPRRLAIVLGLALALLLVLAAGGYALYHAGASAGQAKERAAHLAEDVRTRAQALEDFRALQATFNTINRENTERHESQIAQIRRDADADRAAADRAGGLRIPAPACPATPARTEAAGAGERDETATATVRLPQRIEDDLWALVNFADEVTEQARACQSWIRANGFYGPPPAPEIVSAGNVPAVE